MLGFSPLQNGALPRKAAIKFATIVEESDNRRYVGHGLSEEFQSALRQYRAAASDVEILEGQTGRATVALNLSSARATLATMKELLDRVTERRAENSAAHHDLIGLKTSFDKWLQTVRSRELRDVQRSEAKPRKGETLADALERCRRRIRELRADAHRVRSAPIPSSEAKAFASSYVEALQEAGEPDLHSLIEAGIRRIHWPDHTHLIEGSTDGGRAQFTPELAPAAIRAMAWAQPEVLLKALLRDIDRDADDENALSADQRFKQQATIAADRFAIECEEEMLGRKVDIYPDANEMALVDWRALAATAGEPFDESAWDRYVDERDRLRVSAFKVSSRAAR